MTTIIGIDPGLNCTGIAIHIGDWTVWSARSKERDLPKRVKELTDKIRYAICPLRADLLVIEKPQVYQGPLQKGDPNDLIDLTVLVGALLEALPHEKALLPRPTTWKAQVPKHIHHKRIREKVPGLGRQSKDALDAVGLALYGLEQYAFTKTK